MKRIIFCSALVLLLSVAAVQGIFAAPPDLVGSWTGTATYMDRMGVVTTGSIVFTVFVEQSGFIQGSFQMSPPELFYGFPITGTVKKSNITVAGYEPTTGDNLMGFGKLNGNKISFQLYMSINGTAVVGNLKKQ
jgi:hypothetical protein